MHQRILISIWGEGKSNKEPIRSKLVSHHYD
jgi:hypothetical protein